MKTRLALPVSEAKKIVEYFSHAEKTGLVMKNTPTDSRLFLTEKNFFSAISIDTAYFENIRSLAADFYRRDKSEIHIIYMINKVSAVKIGTERGNGSGGDFHVDSILSPQFKYFVYLSDVPSPSHGAFEISNVWFTLFCLAVNFVTLGGMNKNWGSFSRFDWLSRFQFFEFFFMPFLGQAGTAFSGNTRIIHRGRPNFKNDRFMVTAYTYEKRSSGFIKMLSNCADI